MLVVAYNDNMAKLAGRKSKHHFSATGVSSILHSGNPFVPTIHMNVRNFSLDNGSSWFGGGIDLTPTYINPEEARWFHQTLKDICDKYDTSFYPEWKIWADDYFYLTHRHETRGSWRNLLRPRSTYQDEADHGKIAESDF